MYLELVKGKKPDPLTGTMFVRGKNGQIKEYEANRDLILRQMLYDLTMWYSMANTPKKTRYMSHHVQAFITAFGLANSENTTGTVDSSDDDGPGPPPPAITTSPQTNKQQPPPRAQSPYARPATNATGGGRPAVRRQPSKTIKAGPQDEEIQAAFEKADRLKAADAAQNKENNDPSNADAMKASMVYEDDPNSTLRTPRQNLLPSSGTGT
jgi:hypothetical protein